MQYPHISAHSEDIVRCIKCGLCKSVCPPYLETFVESEGARGRVALVEALQDGRLTLSHILSDRIFTCLNCKACVEACPSGCNVDDLVLSLRAELASRGKIGLIKRLVLNDIVPSRTKLDLAVKAGSVFQRFPGLFSMLGLDGEGGFPKLQGRSFIDSHRPGRRVRNPVMRVGFFVGCGTNFLHTEAGEAIVWVLERHGCEVIVPREQVCCGTPVFNSGEFGTGRKLAERNLEVFEKAKVDAVITGCGSCGLTLKKEWHEVLGVDAREFSNKVYDFSEFLVKELKLQKPRRSFLLAVTYHDPCHLARGQGIKDEPREILKNIPGVNLVEMRESTRCCGGAGTFAFTWPELSRKIGSRKALSIRDTAASMVTTSCPGCYLQLRRVLRANDIEMSVKHVAELYASAL
ncbi:MAG: (Fe-S)-binding protein [Candidatus Eisenbacteria bacterium]|nr:(Fe-S)-binding protein [Candidatus Eisenbacteria bacterium]